MLTVHERKMFRITKLCESDFTVTHITAEPRRLGSRPCCIIVMCSWRRRSTSPMPLSLLRDKNESVQAVKESWWYTSIFCSLLLQSLPPGTVLHDDLCILGYKVSLPGLRGESQRVLVVFGIHDELQVRNVSSQRSVWPSPSPPLFPCSLCHT